MIYAHDMFLFLEFKGKQPDPTLHLQNDHRVVTWIYTFKTLEHASQSPRVTLHRSHSRGSCDRCPMFLLPRIGLCSSAVDLRSSACRPLPPLLQWPFGLRLLLRAPQLRSSGPIQRLSAAPRLQRRPRRCAASPPSPLEASRSNPSIAPL
jgi:hypothetical protein